MEEKTPTRPIGIYMSLEKILEKLEKIDNEMDTRMRKLEAQVSAMWVTHGIMIGAIIFLVTDKLKG
jgi:hypothetical protein